jgi:hypothetical protein
MLPHVPLISKTCKIPSLHCKEICVNLLVRTTPCAVCVFVCEDEYPFPDAAGIYLALKARSHTSLGHRPRILIG